MRRPSARLAAACAFAAATSIITAPAFAGGNPNAPGQQKKDSTSQSTQSSSSSTQSGASSQGTNGSSSTPGMKPANNTAKGTNCTYQDANTCTSTGSNTAQANAKKDSSKQYGNGKTAAQIAASRGVPAGSNIYGPGNSQPHKVSCPGSKHSPDVHAYGHGKNTCGSTAASTSASIHTSSKANTTSNRSNTSSTSKTSSTVHTSVSTTHTSSSTSNNVSSSTQTSSSPTKTAVTTSGGGVLGATTTLARPKTKAHHGVLGTVTRVKSGTLPFTGFPVWLAVLIALGMIGAGVTLRRPFGARV